MTWYTWGGPPILHLIAQLDDPDMFDIPDIVDILDKRYTIDILNTLDTLDIAKLSQAKQNSKTLSYMYKLNISKTTSMEGNPDGRRS